ncbi:hypothetical protein LRQ96_004418 [Citrobacter freundii]
MTALNKQALRERYSSQPIPKCHICGAEMTVQLANAESKCRELAAENGGLKKAAEFATADDMWIEQADGMLDYRYCEWYVDVLKAAMETPATDAILAEVRAQGVEIYADTLDRGADDAERDGFDDGVKFLRAEAEGVRKFAAQLRKGAKS